MSVINYIKPSARLVKFHVTNSSRSIFQYLHITKTVNDCIRMVAVSGIVVIYKYSATFLNLNAAEALPPSFRSCAT